MNFQVAEANEDYKPIFIYKKQSHKHTERERDRVRAQGQKVLLFNICD